MNQENVSPVLRHYTLATAGHVDHGKSALVRALTGTDPDRLPEEKKRGITIDLGFAHLDLPLSGSAVGRLRVGIVDVPGHEDFIKNMVAGVGAVDGALLAVAADDGWMPQTEEHLRILEAMGITRLVVALTKADLPSSPNALEMVCENIRTRLADTTFSQARIVPTSIPTSRGVDELRSTLAALLAETPPAADFGKPRLPIDRVFTLRGIGTVVTGTLTGGTIGRGQMVVVRPGAGAPVRVRSLQSHGRDLASMPPGGRAALSLPDLPADPATLGAPARGRVVTVEGVGEGSRVFDGTILFRTGAWLEAGAPVRVHVGSGHHAARLYPLESGGLPGGEVRLIRVRLETPALVFAGDRCVVRDAAGRTTLGGGQVLDPDPPGRRRALPGQRRLLARRAAAPGVVRVFVESAVTRDQVVPRAGLLVRSLFSAEDIDAALVLLAREEAIFLSDSLAADAGWWRSLHVAAVGAIDTAHRTHPEHAGLSLTALQTELGAMLPRLAGVFEALVADLTARGGCVRAGASIRRASHRPELPPKLQAAGRRVRAALLDKPLEPPSRASVAPDVATSAALRFLIEAGEAIELNDEIVVALGSFVRMRAGIVRHLRTHGPATASDLRQTLGTTRRILVPLLERLDRDGVTRREGDRRVLK